jgi:hypothetical protein
MTLNQKATRYARDNVPAHLRICGEAHYEGAYIAGHRAGSRLTKSERAVIKAAMAWKANRNEATPIYLKTSRVVADLDAATYALLSEKVCK